MSSKLVLKTFEHTQSSASTTWTITHNLNLSSPIVDVYVDNGGTFEKISPLQITVTSNNVVTVTFTTAKSGRALIA